MTYQPALPWHAVHEVSDRALLPFRHDLIRAVDAEPEDVFERVVAVEAAAVGPDLNDPRPSPDAGRYSRSVCVTGRPDRSGDHRARRAGPREHGARPRAAGRSRPERAREWECIV